MNVSVNWLREYLNFDLPPTTELVERIGAQLGGIESVTDIGAKYQGALIVKVVECSKLENSDHLNLCFVDDGGIAQGVERREDGLIQVVCGAPNVQAGVTVAWLPPGATVPSTFDSDPFVLESRELRGAVSNGMLASAKELAIGDSHEGLLLLDDDLQPGTSFAEAYKLNDTIIDIENKMFTHRPDCFGQLGVAREVAGILGQKFESPEWYLADMPAMTGDGLPLTVVNESPELVPRFMAVALKDVVVAPSPIWLQTYLSRVGVRPINNLVDITNYIMLLTGQPTHAYDYDKVAGLSDGEGAVLTARQARDDETVELLNGKTIKPRHGALVIATDRQAIGLAGVMGGANTEVDNDTRNIILECASFDMYSVRRTSMAHGLFTDAVTRFTKGQSPLQNGVVAGQAVELFQDLAGGIVASDVMDIDNTKQLDAVSVTAGFVNDRLGLELSAAEMAQLLANVEFEVVVQDEALTAMPPFWRTDIERAEDIVEEIGRLYGFDKLPLELPRRTLALTAGDQGLRGKALIRASLAAHGANELLTYSFVHGDLLAKTGHGTDTAFRIANALSPDLQYYRPNALGSLLDKVHLNIKAGHDDFYLFEMSKGHEVGLDDDEGLPAELELLDAVYAAKESKDGAAFYRVRALLDALAEDLGIELEYRPIGQDVSVTSFDSARTAAVSVKGGQVIGHIGEFTRSVQKSFKLPAACAGFSIDRSALLANAGGRSRYAPLPRFPRVEQDICLRTAADTGFADINEVVEAALNEHRPAETRLRITPIDIYQKDDGRKQTTFRISLASYQKTMTDQELSALLDHVTAAAAERLGAERV